MTKDNNKLSVTMAVYNEEQYLSRCLSSVDGLADEIVIVDGNSSDKTIEIAKKFKAKIIKTTNKKNFHINKKMANDSAIGEWILQLDADEVVSKELFKEIQQTVLSNPIENGFWIPRRNFFLGQFLTKGGTYPDYTLRLYRRLFGNLPAKDVHEQAKVQGKVGYLKNDLLHYSNPTFAEYIEKRFNRYTDLMSYNLTGGFITNVFLRPIFDHNQGFLSIYLRHLGFLDGFPGFVWALFSSLHFPIAYFKKIEDRRIEKNESRDN